MGVIYLKQMRLMLEGTQEVVEPMFSLITAHALMLILMTTIATNLLPIAMDTVITVLITAAVLILLIGTRRHIMITIITPAMTATSDINK